METYQTTLTNKVQDPESQWIKIVSETFTKERLLTFFLFLFKIVLSKFHEETLELIKSELRNSPDENGNYVGNFVYYTYNMEQFEKMECNRDSKKKHISLMATEAVERGIILPVLVDNDRKVHDGQHRVEGCREALENGQEIHPLPFIIAPDSDIEQIRVLNITQKPWVAKDYLKHFMSYPESNHSNIDPEEYKKYDVYQKEFGYFINDNELRAICMGRNAFTGDITTIFKGKSNVTFKILRTDEEIRYIAKCILDWGTVKKGSYYSNRAFQRALLRLLMDNNYDNDKMIDLMNSNDGSKIRTLFANKKKTKTYEHYISPLINLWNSHYKSTPLSITM